MSSTPDDYFCYENSGWTFKNNTNVENTNGEFTTYIPFNYWLGHFEDLNNFLINSCLELILTRCNSDKNLLIV